MMQTEKQIERECKKLAESQGWMSMKLTSPNLAGVPDRMFISPKGRVEFVEFKKASVHLSPIQERVIEIFKAHKVDVWVIRNLHDFKMWVMEV